MAEPRVVVTGLGAVTPVGHNVKDMWSAFDGGRSGLASTSLFDPAEYGLASRVAAEVKDWDAGAYFEKRALMAQPFVRAVLDEGEASLFFFDGALSHAVRKVPRAGDFRVQEEHGGAITAMEPVDDVTLRITLGKAWPSFPYLLGGPVGMITNPKAVAAAASPAAFAANPVGGGAGPFVVERFAPGDQLVLTAREGYWGGDVCLDQLRFVTTGLSPVDSLSSGQTDVAFLRDPKLIDAADSARRSESVML